MDTLLKEISLEGFKSFRDRTTFKFDGPFTAIVGPNGSGKSNVVDAVKWVLGDPSPRSIRAASGQEAIYRPADGNGEPAGFCAVSLKIDNLKPENEDEPAVWEIERRYYRSSESTYSINGRTARLKDVRALMARMGFGLGSLSVVGQGEIDGFLSLVPADRRLVFEDLARISDFKANKRKILGRLEECARNHDRMRDLIGEIGSRVERLTVQAEAARRHAELVEAQEEVKAQLAAMEYFLAKRNVERHERRQEDLTSELEKARKREEDSVRGLASSKDALEDARRESAATLSECEERRRELDHAEAEERRLTDAARHLSTLLGTLEDELKEREQRVDKLRARQEELGETAQGADEERIAAYRRRLDYELYLSRRWGHTRACERERERLASRVGRLAGEGSLFARDVEFHIRRAEALRVESEGLGDRKLELLEEIDMREVERVDLARESERLTALKTEQEAALAGLAETLATDREKRESAEQRQGTLSTEIAALARERDLLTDLEASSEGYGEAVRAVLERRDHLPGLRGTLGELIDVRPGREEVIERALGDALEFLVCETLSQALEVIDVARREELGTVTCLVRELIPDADTEPGEDDLLSACSIAPDLRPLLDLLLRGAREIDELRGVSAETLSRVLVTSSGDVFRPPAFLSGGSPGSPAAGILTRRARLKELDEVLSGRRADAERLADEISSLTDEIARVEREQAEVRQALDETIDRLRANEAALQTNSDIREQVARDLSALDEKLAELNTEREGCLENATLAERGMAAIKRVRVDADTDLRRLESELPRLSRQVEDLRVRLQRSIVEEASYKEEAERARAEIERLEGELDTAQKETTEREARLEQVRKDVLGSENDLQRASEHRKLLAERLPELEAKEREVSERIDTFSNAVDDAEEALEEARRSVSSLENAVHTEEVRLAELRGGLSALESSLDAFPEFAERIRSGEMGTREIPSRKDLAERMDLITADIEELGDVNPLAIEEERTAGERLAELRSEREDLLQAEEELRKALEEVERESERAFITTFNAARERFAEVFASLFPGGSGELSLTDTGNPLESGIDVRVRFPGKGELDLLQFSGGERALIALALLFAILKVKPSSFTILDEVEAALDDPNTQKFLDYLGSEFPDRQFVLITHNKITMERANRLYGVTMREGGVSQVVSVDLRKLKEEGIEEVLGAPN